MTDLPRKAPALEKEIAQVTKNDIKVRVIGEVSESGEGFIKLKDNTGELRINTEQKFQVGESIRVFGTIEPNSEELALRGELIQGMSKLDKKVYKRMKLLTS